jgi:hypothetical protein
VRAALGVVALVAVGCGDGSSTTSSAFSASFSNLNGANTSGVAFSTPTVTCVAMPDVMTCRAFELPGEKGREVDVSVFGTIAADTDYPIALTGSMRGTVAVQDPTTYGTASGLRQWFADNGQGAVHVATWNGKRVTLSYFAHLGALGSPAAGSFDIAGDAGVDVTTAAP